MAISTTIFSRWCSGTVTKFGYGILFQRKLKIDVFSSNGIILCVQCHNAPSYPCSADTSSPALSRQSFFSLNHCFIRLFVAQRSICVISPTKIRRLHTGRELNDTLQHYRTKGLFKVAIRHSNVQVLSNDIILHVSKISLLTWLDNLIWNLAFGVWFFHLCAISGMPVRSLANQTASSERTRRVSLNGRV